MAVVVPAGGRRVPARPTMHRARTDPGPVVAPDQAAHSGHLDDASTTRSGPWSSRRPSTATTPCKPQPALAAFVLLTAGRHFEARLLMDGVVEMARRTGSPLHQAGIDELRNPGEGGRSASGLEAMLECAATGRAGRRPAPAGPGPRQRIRGRRRPGRVGCRRTRARGAALLDPRRQSLDDDGAALTSAMLTAYRAIPWCRPRLSPSSRRAAAPRGRSC